MENPGITVPTSAGDLQFSYEYGEWCAIHHLPGWSGYHCENSLPELADGQVYLLIESSPGNEPSAKQLQALAWLLAQPDAANKIIVDAIYALYPQQRKEAAAYLDKEMLDMAYPDVRRVDDLRRLISLSRVRIYEESKDGLPYLGFDFECNWDPEHGHKVLINGHRIVEIGTDALNPTNIAADGGRI